MDTYEKERADLELITKLQKFISIASRELDEWKEVWRQNEAFYEGRQWSDEQVKALANWRATPVDNIIYETVETMHAICTDQRPVGYAYNRAGGDQTTADILTSIIESIWEDCKIERKDSKAWKERMIYGNSFWKVWYSQDEKDVMCDGVRPENLYIDPFADDIQGARFIAEKKLMPLSSILEMYPEHYDRLINSGTTVRGGAGTSYDGYSNHHNSTNDERKEDSYDRQVDLWEVWFRDTASEEYTDVTQEDGKEEFIKNRLKYPRGRVAKFVGDVILEDRKNPYKFKGSKAVYPYIKVACVQNVYEFYDKSIVQPMIRDQQEVNQIKAQVLDNIKALGNSKIFAKVGVMDIDTFSNHPAEIVEFDIEQGERIEDNVKVVDGNSLPNDVVRMLETTKRDMRSKAGLSDALTGNVGASQRPGSVRAAFEASMGRIREMIRLGNAGLAELAEMSIDLVQQFYGVDRIVYLSNPMNDTKNYEDPKLSKEVREALSDELVQKELRSPLRKVIVNQANEEYSGNVQDAIQNGLSQEDAADAVRLSGVLAFKNDIRKGRYKYRMGVHPLQARDKQGYIETMIQLLQFSGQQAGAILPHLIRSFDVPNGGDIVKDIDENKQLRQQLQQLQEQVNQGQQGQ